MSNVVASRAIWISASLLPLPLLMAAATTGGIFIFLAIAYMTFAIIFIDEYSHIWRGTSSQTRSELTREFFPLVLGIAHFAILGIAVHALGSSTSSTLEWLMHLYAFGLFFGVISFANAHQLWRNDSHLHRKLGEWIFASLMFGYYAPVQKSASQTDSLAPSQNYAAKTGESFYTYLRRAIPQTLAETLLQEAHQNETGTYHKIHPVLTRFAIGALFLALTAWMSSASAVLGLVLVAMIAQTITYLSRYVQHYGLNSKIAARTAVQKWKSPKVLWALFKPADDVSEFGARKSGLGAPLLPFSLLSMCFIALVPSLWQRLMDQRVSVWKDTAKFAES